MWCAVQHPHVRGERPVFVTTQRLRKRIEWWAGSGVFLPSSLSQYECACGQVCCHLPAHIIHTAPSFSTFVSELVVILTVFPNLHAILFSWVLCVFFSERRSEY
jgi:hypothetical protein